MIIVHMCKSLTEVDTSTAVDNKSMETSSPVVPLPQPVLPQSETQTKILSTIRLRIFNEMPIRVLAFDAAGTSLEIIDRNEMFKRVLQNVYISAVQPDFEAKWAAAQLIIQNDDPTISDSGYKQQQKLVSDLVKWHSRYSILSHTWIRDTPGDVIFQGWATRGENPRGNAKINKFCEVSARDYGVPFGWMDTVCINKESSTELDESIRSMYKWYRGAHICIAYISETRLITRMHLDSWFTRGWTLQELLAPQAICFYDMDWDDFLAERELALKDLPFYATDSLSHADIQREIRTATSISEYEIQLCRRGDMEQIAISRRFQLASKRQVTREEDSSYSLMGLLGVDISVAYGEGSKRAFFRLVRELLSSKVRVLDIFNHSYANSPRNRLMPAHILQYFYRTYHFDPYTRDSGMGSLLDKWQPLEPITLTHLGVRISVLLIPATRFTEPPKGKDRDFTPKGAYHARLTLDIWSDTENLMISTNYFNLLDSRLYKSNKSATPIGEPASATFAIMNFGMDHDDIILPQMQGCFSVLLDCGNIAPGMVRPSDSINIQIIPTRDAPIFKFDSGADMDRIPVNDLDNHGIQLVTLFL